MSWHGYQLAEQMVKFDLGKTWQSAGMRWLTPAKTGYNLGSPKNWECRASRNDFAQVRLD